MPRCYARFAAIAAWVVLTLIPAALAGPLDPPAGPIASTHKPLSEVEPRTAINATNTPGDATCLFRITQPGSYYLTDNATGVPGKNGVIVTASNVTIDLNGFTLFGGGGNIGVLASGTIDSLAIRNGSTAGWSIAGIDVSDAAGSLVENAIARANGAFGIRTGSRGVIRSCVAVGNGGSGFLVFQGGVIESCNATGNTGAGFATGFGSVVRSCVARESNPGFGSTGESVITECTAYSNQGPGIVAANRTVVERCSSNFNAGAGISAGVGCSILSNVCAGNSGSGGFGVTVTGGDNRIEGNNFTGNSRGVDITSPGNFVARNTCSGNTLNWNIVVGNAVAPIASASVNVALISGNTYGGSLGNTDPNANFTY